MTLTSDFQGQIWKKKLYPRNGMAYWYRTEGMWVDRKSEPLCDLELAMTLALDFQDQILKKKAVSQG